MIRLKDLYAFTLLLLVWGPSTVVGFVAGLVLWPAWDGLRSGWEAVEDFYNKG